MINENKYSVPNLCSNYIERGGRKKMAIVTIQGIYMNSELKTTTYDGNSKTSVQLDIYQKDSPSSEKVVQLKTDDLELLHALSEHYDLGSIITVKATVNAYKNKSYYKLLEVV